MAKRERESHQLNQRRTGQLLGLQQNNLLRSDMPIVKEVKIATDLDTLLLHDEDLGLYQDELRLAKVSQRYYDISIEGARLFRRLGVEDQVSKNIFFGTEDTQFQDNFVKFHMQLLPRITTNILAAREYKDWGKKIKALANKEGLVLDPEAQIFAEYALLEGVTLEDIFREGGRANKEKISLLELQISWLLNHPGTDYNDEETTEKLPTETASDSAEIPQPTFDQPLIDIQSPPLLAGWNLFWTNRQYSADLNDLVALSTADRRATISGLTEVSRGKISIKPGSIVRALEFHLQKNVIQKALSMRNKYVPPEIREWVKIKRGKDRIFLLIPQEGTAIFSVDGRDEAYEGLKRR